MTARCNLGRGSRCQRAGRDEPFEGVVPPQVDYRVPEYTEQPG